MDAELRGKALLLALEVALDEIAKTPDERATLAREFAAGERGVLFMVGDGGQSVRLVVVPLVDGQIVAYINDEPVLGRFDDGLEGGPGA